MVAIDGVWVVFAYDINAYPVAIFDNEVKALQVSNGLGYTHVKFWKFDQLWDHLHRDVITRYHVNIKPSDDGSVLICHNLNTVDVFVTRVTDRGELVRPNMEIIDENSIKLFGVIEPEQVRILK